MLQAEVGHLRTMGDIARVRDRRPSRCEAEDESGCMHGAVACLVAEVQVCSVQPGMNLQWHVVIVAGIWSFQFCGDDKLQAFQHWSLGIITPRPLLKVRGVETCQKSAAVRQLRNHCAGWAELSEGVHD